MKVDTEVLDEYGLMLTKIKLFPYFDMAHYFLMCLAVREDIHQYQTSIPNFHKRHPLACYFSSMLTCFGGGMLVHFLLGEPILDDFKTHNALVLASFCWYLVFFSPFDLVYKLIKFLPVKIVLSVCKELQRTRKIVDGVAHASHLYPNSYVIIVIVGALKGSGSGFLSIIDRFNRGFYLPNSNELLHPSFASKGCLVASLLFTLERKSLLTVPRNLLFFSVVVFFGYVKLMSIFFKSFDPFIPFENLTAALFFGGIIDAIKKARHQSSSASAQAQAASTVMGGGGIGGSAGTTAAGSASKGPLPNMGAGGGAGVGVGGGIGVGVGGGGGGLAGGKDINSMDKSMPSMDTDIKKNN